MLQTQATRHTMTRLPCNNMYIVMPCCLQLRCPLLLTTCSCGRRSRSRRQNAYVAFVGDFANNPRNVQAWPPILQSYSLSVVFSILLFVTQDQVFCQAFSCLSYWSDPVLGCIPCARQLAGLSFLLMPWELKGPGPC